MPLLVLMMCLSVFIGTGMSLKGHARPSQSELKPWVTPITTNYGGVQELAPKDNPADPLPFIS